MLMISRHRSKEENFLKKIHDMLELMKNIFEQ